MTRLSLAEALASNRLEDFAAQAEADGYGIADRAQFEGLLGRVTAPPPEGVITLTKHHTEASASDRLAGADEIAAEIAKAIQSQGGQFGNSTDLSGDLTEFMVFEAVDLVAVAKQLSTSFDIFRGSA